MPLNIDQIPDYVESVLDKFERNRYTDLTLDLRFKVAKRLLDKTNLNWSTGSKYEFKVRIATENNARVTGLYDSDSLNVVSMVDHGEVPWSQYTTGFAYDIQEEAFQTDRSQVLVDYLRMKDHGMHEDFWELLEQHIWTSPASSTQSPRQMYGIPHWIVKNGAVAGGDRNGGNPSGFASGAAGIDSSTYDRWNNWTFAHDGTVTRDGFIKRIVKAMKFCKFEATHSYPALVAANKGEQYALCTTYLMWEQLCDFLRAQNDNLGRDGAAMYDGNPTILGNTVMEVPYLTENYSGAGDGNDPIYGINWNSLKFARRRGWWMKRTAPIRTAGSHNVYSVHMDSHIASVCTDRSQNFVGHRVAA